MRDVYEHLSMEAVLMERGAAARAPVSERVRAMFGAYMGGADAVRLNLGCGRSPEPGFVNLDRVGGAGADVVFDLEWPASNERAAVASGLPAEGWGRLPFDDASVDVVLASHVLEHIRGLIPLMREIHRILKPGGHLIAVTPYASSDDAWEDPTHVRAFTERSWAYFNQKLYAMPGHAGSYPSEIDFLFVVAEMRLIPYPDLLGQDAGALIGQASANMEVRKRFMRNVIKELQAVLRKDAA